MLETSCDVLIPAALECQITEENAGRPAAVLMADRQGRRSSPQPLEDAMERISDAA